MVIKIQKLHTKLFVQLTVLARNKIDNSDHDKDNLQKLKLSLDSCDNKVIILSRILYIL